MTTPTQACTPVAFEAQSLPPGNMAMDSPDEPPFTSE